MSRPTTVSDIALRLPMHPTSGDVLNALQQAYRLGQQAGAGRAELVREELVRAVRSNVVTLPGLKRQAL